MVILPPTEEPAEYNENYILYWNNVALDLNRLVITINGPNNGPPSAARALGILHLAINDAYFAIRPDPNQVATTYLRSDSSDPAHKLPEVGDANDARSAVAGAASTVLNQLYTAFPATIADTTIQELQQFVNEALTDAQAVDQASPSFEFGTKVGKAMLDLLAIKPGEPGVEQGSYKPTPGQYRFDDDPTNPVRIVPEDVNNPNGPQKAVKIYNAPFYGMTAKRVAVQGVVDGVPTEHIVADPPVGFGTDDVEEYNSNFDEVIRLGGATSLNATQRTPEQQTSAYFWAYDGSNLIGTPLRLINQILRKVAWERKPAAPTDERTNADFARLFALANAAIADAGIFAWQEKYTFEFWRPLSGVREDTENSMVDPFWLELGAPSTNTDQISFKPPFPAYVSGHATFVSAAFQAARLFYKRRDGLQFAPDGPDDISFDFVSDELNGINRDLRQPYDPSRPITDQVGTVRTRVSRHYNSLWAAIFDAGISRVFLGVHWRFDAFASKDVLAATAPNEDGLYVYKSPAEIKYATLGPRSDRPGKLFPIGGVPLGIGIANDIFQTNLQPTPTAQQPMTTAVQTNGSGEPDETILRSKQKASAQNPILKAQNGAVSPYTTNGNGTL